MNKMTKDMSGIPRTVPQKPATFTDPINAEIRRAMRHKCRGIKGPHADQRQARHIRPELKRAALRVVKIGIGFDARFGKQWQRFIENAPLGDGKD